MTIEISHLSKRFGSVAAVDDVSLRVAEGSLTALLGPSGSGKTTVLRMIAGLEIPDSGSISIGGRDVTDMPAQRREVGFVFQQYALFKHMRVRDNIAFGLKVRGRSQAETRARVSELVSLLRLDGLEDRYPSQISGGQRQRVALARALAVHPQVLLLDEPFSALDARVRDELREWLHNLHEQLHVTSLFVTHDQDEAMELADSVVVMNAGSIEQEGTPEELFHAPASAFVMRFLGRVNSLNGTASHGQAEFGGLHAPFPSANGVATNVVAYFRPEEVTLSGTPSADALVVTVSRLVPGGASYRVEMEVAATSEHVIAEIDRSTRERLAIAPGQTLYAAPRDIRLFAAES